MTDAITLLRDSQAKLTARVTKLRNQLAIAEAELADTETALKVMIRLGLSPDVQPDEREAPAPSGKPSDLVYANLGFGEVEGRTPKEVHEAMGEAVGVNADNVRTILWRMAQRTQIRTRDGRYWRYDRQPVSNEEGSGDEPEPSSDVRREEPSTTSEPPIFTTANHPVAG